MTRPAGWKAAGAGVLAGGIFLAGATRSPWLGLAGILGCLGLLAIVRVPGIGMGVLTFLLPLERMQRLTNDDASFTISLMRIVAMACLGAIFLARFHQRRSFWIDKSLGFYGVYVLIAILGITYSTDPYGTKRFVGTMLSNCLLLGLYLNYLSQRHQIHLTIAIWLAANVAGAAYSTYDWHRGSGAAGAEKLIDPDKGAQTTSDRWSTVYEDIAEWDAQRGLGLRRSMGPTSHPTVYGLNLVLTVPFFLALLLRRRPIWQQTGLLLSLGLVTYNIFLSNTRASLLAAALTGILCVAYGLIRLGRWHIPAALIGLVVLIPLVPQDAINRILEPSNYSTSGSATLRIRLKYWDAGIRIVQDHFLLGLGVGNERAVPEYLRDPEIEHHSVHNIYLQVAMETGIVGWLGFFAFVGMAFQRTRAAARALRDQPGWEDEHRLLLAIQVAMIVVLAYGIQVDVFNFSLKGWWLLVCIALVLHRWSTRIPPGTAPGAIHAASGHSN